MSARGVDREREGPPVGIVSGSGMDLRPLLDEVVLERSFHEFPGLADGHVAGHACTFVEGRCAGRPIVLQCGRLHAYEGLAFGELTQTVDVLHAFGVRQVIFTNSAGGLLSAMRPGDLVAVARVRTWPYHAFSLPESLVPGLLAPGCDHTGTYLWMHGPCYETPAEIGALRSMGVDAVGMSTAPELHRCGELGLRAAVVSCVTNLCDKSEAITHTRIIETARRVSGRLCGIIRSALPVIAGEERPR